jgi:hypothetical protein
MFGYCKFLLHNRITKSQFQVCIRGGEKLSWEANTCKDKCPAGAAASKPGCACPGKEGEVSWCKKTRPECTGGAADNLPACLEKRCEDPGQMVCFVRVNLSNLLA